jgi:hypothetical protein
MKNLDFSLGFEIINDSKLETFMCVDWEYSDTRFFIANPHKKTAEAIQTSRHHHRKFGIFAGYLRGDIHIDQRSNKTTPNRFH